MTPEEELAHLRAPSADPKQRMVDYWGHRAELAEAEVERLWKVLDEIWQLSDSPRRLTVVMAAIHEIAEGAIVGHKKPPGDRG